MSRTLDILVADDLQTQRLAIEVALAELGERVVSVESGRDALKYLLDHDAAVILLDVNMPGMDGFETAALIRQRQRTAHTPIIFLTADTDEVQAMRGYALGAVDYLFCPFQPEVLRTKVKVFVELGRVQERIRREAEQSIALSREQAARAAAEEQSQRLRFLAEASGVLTRSLDEPPFVEELLALFVPRVADAAALVLSKAPDPPGDSTWTQVWNPNLGASEASPHPDPVLAEALERCVAKRERVPIPSAAGDGVVGIAVPVADRGMCYGALGVQMTTSGRRYGSDLVELIELVAGRTAIALDNLRLHGELHDRDRRKDEFLAMLSHELRNPLGTIATGIHLLDMVGTTDERAVHAREVIARQSMHLTRIVDDLLEVSRVTAGQIALVMAPMNVRDVVDRGVEALRASGRATEHQLTVTGEGAMVEADAARMEQVVTNLLVNALKYTDRGGMIRVEALAAGDDAVIRVIDSGIGISPELLPRVFDVFVQGQRTLDRAEGGLGLGLALVRRLVELQGGTVSASSAGSGHGSTFEVRVPRLLAPAAPRPDETAPHRGFPKLRVLLVEDHHDLRETMSFLLTLHGQDVHEAATGPTAVEIASRVTPQLALVDLGLPGFDGFEVARRLRENAGEAMPTVVALTGYGRADDRRRTLRAGFDAHLVKPVSMQDLRQILELAARRVQEQGGAGDTPAVTAAPPSARTST